MANRFARVDLSDAARDFRPLALEPGVPLLDRSNANDRIVFRWFGGLVAEPEYEGESINFFARDDHDGRLEEVTLLPASDADLKGPLKNDVAALKERLDRAKPENSTERALHKILGEQIERLTGEEPSSDRDNYFFRYKDVLGRLRLVWCWGYQRVDQEPAPPVVCTDTDCSLLFVRRPGKSPKCPSCEALLLERPKKKNKKKRRSMFAALVLLLAAAALGYWFFTRDKLIAKPGDWSGPVGSRIAFNVKTPGIFGLFSRDVSQEALTVVDDPRIVRFEHFGVQATARNPGKTLVHFHLGGRSGTATLSVAPAKPPTSIAIEPARAELAIGSTSQLKLIGTYEDGNTVELTDAAEWLPKNDRIVYAMNGFLEGLAEGNSTASVRYRASPAHEYQTAEVTVSVTATTYKSLEVAVEPDPVTVGRGGRLNIEAIGEDGQRYSVVDSSQLKLQIEPPHAAMVRAGHIEGIHPGGVRIDATLGDLAASHECEVVRGNTVERLIVSPERLAMVVGEVTDLDILAPEPGPVRLTSSSPLVVQVTPDRRLLGRGEGTATVDVRQNELTRTIEVTVGPADVQTISSEPGYVGVPIDHSVGMSVWGHLEDGRRIELANDLIATERKPSARNVDFNPRALSMAGVTSTEAGTPQGVSFRYRTLKTDAPVEVVRAPLRLDISPPGPVDLPLGQAVQPEAWANYPAGHTIRVSPERVRWESKAAKGVEGLVLRGSKVLALKADVGPLTVWGSYLDRASNRVEFNSVEAADIDLIAEVDRHLLLVGETDRVHLRGTGPKGDVELVPEMAQFKSADEKLMSIGPKRGDFRTNAPGRVSITASHAASKKPAKVDFRLVDPADANLVFKPDAAQVVVDERARLELFLEAKAKGSDKTYRERMIGPNVSYAIPNPDAILWQAPILVGRKPAGPFEMAASFPPLLTRSGTARVEVLEAEAPTAIRVVPSEVALAEGQMAAFSVEAQFPKNKAWKEIQPDAIRWDVPSSLVWARPNATLRPAATLPPGTSGKVQLTATYRDQKANATIQTTEPALDPADASVALLLHREPEGRYLPVGSQQRYSIVLKKGDVEEPAAGVRWMQNFENKFVHWRGPVLTAKKAGYEEWLTAEVGGRTVRFRTQTVNPFQNDLAPPDPKGRPVELAILSDQGGSVRFPVGAEFDDFRIEAKYPSGMTRMVTKKATMRTSDGSTGLVSFRKGHIVGLSPGKTVIQAEFGGASTKKGLAVEVTADVDIDEIVVSAPKEMLQGETIPMTATGFKKGKSVGLLTGLGTLSWSSDNPRSVGVQGPAVTGLSLGSGNVTVKLAGVNSKPAPVQVVDSIADPLVVDQKKIRMRMGESRQLGTDVNVFRGDTNLSSLVRATSARPGVVRWVPETRSLQAVSPGSSTVTFASGDKLAHMQVEVVSGGPVDGNLIVEPAIGTVASGTALPLRVYLVGSDGIRIDRTDSAVFSSTDAKTVSMLGNRACGLSPGTAEVSVMLADSQTPGRATVTVTNEPIDELFVEPAQATMSVGDVQPLRVSGRTASGTFEVFPQPRLKMSVGGPNPTAVQVVGQTLDALSPGTASVAVDWDNRLKQEVPVAVSADQLTGLTIEPRERTINPATGVVYQVTGMKGGQRRVLEPEDGVKLALSDPKVAQAAGMSVVGSQPGRTLVVAEYAGQRAEAVLDVMQGDFVASTEVGTGDVVIDEHGEVVHVDHPGHGHGHGHGGVHVDRHGHGHVDHIGAYAVDTHGTVVAPVIESYPAVTDIHDLRFLPNVIRMANGSPGIAPRVFQVLPGGATGAEVTGHPQLELNDPLALVSITRDPSGRHILHPQKTGETRLGAKLGLATAESPLLVQVAGTPVVGLARLDISPQPLDLWLGETGTFASVSVSPGIGQLPIPVDYTVTPMLDQSNVTVEGGRQIRAATVGEAIVTVRSVAPGTPYDGLTGTAIVRVGGKEALHISPSEVSLKVNESTPAFVVSAKSADGQMYPVSAVIESVDPAVLAPDGITPGRFIARGLGTTQVRATYRNQDLFADVHVTGQRFLDVESTLNEGANDFSVSLEVLAAKSEGPLEYRVSVVGQPTSEAWATAQESGEFRRVVLNSPQVAYGARDARYSLLIEARSTTDGSTERYPFTFRLAPKIVTETP